MHHAPDGLACAQLWRQLAEDQVAVVHAAPRHLHEVLQLLLEGEVVHPLRNHLRRRREAELRGLDLGLSVAGIVLSPTLACRRAAYLAVLVKSAHTAASASRLGTVGRLVPGGTVDAVLPACCHLLPAAGVVLCFLRAEIDRQLRAVDVQAVQLLPCLESVVCVDELRDDHVLLLDDGQELAEALHPDLQLRHVHVARHAFHVEGVGGLRRIGRLLLLRISGILLLLGHLRALGGVLHGCALHWGAIIGRLLRRHGRLRRHLRDL
mmetsp:Transcript_59888/g.171843  ORF Transcript_59888/g.171843 Transcript_59888/m.171843 type:complete len:265 (+) Transcript_59888:1336-2130(+)